MAQAPARWYPPGAEPRGERERKRALDQRRGSSAQRGYDADWQRARLAHLRAEPLCRFCAARGLTVAATVVDHIEPITARPDLRLAAENLRSLCKPCHDARTARDQGFNRGKRGSRAHG